MPVSDTTLQDSFGTISYIQRLLTSILGVKAKNGTSISYVQFIGQ